MRIKVVREGPPAPLSYSDIHVGEAFVFAQHPRFRRWRTLNGKAGERRFKDREKAAVAAAKSMSGNLRARVIFCAEWHEPLVVWNAEWK